MMNSLRLMRGWPSAKIALCSDRASDALPEWLLQFALEDLAGVLARQGVGELDPLRDLVAGEPRLQIRADLFLSQYDAAVRLDERAHLLAELFVGNAEHRAVGDAGYLHQFGFNFGRVDVGAAENDHVAGAPRQIEVAVIVEEADITGRDQPATRRLAALVGIAVVGEVGVAIASANDLAGLPWRQH